MLEEVDAGLYDLVEVLGACLVDAAIANVAALGVDDQHGTTSLGVGAQRATASAHGALVRKLDAIPVRIARVYEVGVDLVDAADFREAERGSFLVRALFNEDEVRLVRESHPKDVPVGYAFAFGAKEAAFKATSQPLRAWRQRHDGGLFFEVRDFALAADGLHAEGVRRAANVFPTLGIDRIRLGHARLGDLVLVVALAIGTNET